MTITPEDVSSALDLLDAHGFDADMGLCLSCKTVAHGVEPDARAYTCPSCDAKAVFGLEEIIIMGAP
jgi:hypothetical protein